jgi:N-acetylglucosamine-6-phosphate deacetylase
MSGASAFDAEPHAGFVDLQVNGYGGVDFNGDGLTPDDLHAACVRLQADGVAACLATIITDHVDAMAARLSRLAALRDADSLAEHLIAGFHVEGPFISPRDGFRGAHPADAVIPADIDVAERLLDAGDGLVRILTLAPECDPGARVTRALASKGIVVSAGHTDAGLEQLEQAIDAGLTMFTHVGNGCPRHLHRHDNIIQRALRLSDRLHLCFIADGAHVPYSALANYLRLTGVERAIVVSDAVAPAGLGPGRYQLGRQDVVVGEDMVPRAPDGSHFVGSGVTMRVSARRLVEHVGLSHEAVRKLTVENPGRVLGRSTNDPIG